MRLKHFVPDILILFADTVKFDKSHGRHIVAQVSVQTLGQNVQKKKKRKERQIVQN